MEFADVPTFGLHWKGKYIQNNVGSTGRRDNAGRMMSLPKGSIGYVSAATAGSILVVFGQDLRRPPEPTSAVHTVSDRRYQFVCTFGLDDWTRLDLRLSK